MRRELEKSCTEMSTWSSVWGSGFRVQGIRVQGSGFRVQGLRFRVQSPGFRFQGSGYKGSEFRVQGTLVSGFGKGYHARERERE